MVPARTGPIDNVILTFDLRIDGGGGHLYVGELESRKRSLHQLRYEFTGADLHQVRHLRDQVRFADGRVNPQKPARRADTPFVGYVALLEIILAFLQRTGDRLSR